jgi:hypothetical protein
LKTNDVASSGPAPDIRTKIKYQLLEIYAKNNADHRIKATLFEIIYAFQFVCWLQTNLKVG